MIKTGSRPKACLSGLIKRGALTIRKAPLFFAPPPAPASPFHHFVVSPPPCGGGQVLRYRCPRSLQAVDSKFLEEKGTVPLRHLPTPIQGVGGERSEPEGVSRQADTIHAALVIIMASAYRRLLTVKRLKGRPFNGQAKGQCRLTWQSYAGLPPAGRSWAEP